MIMQFLGILDLLISATFGLMIFGVYFKSLILIAAIYLIAKGLIFITSLASILDIALGIVLLIGYYTIVPHFILVIAALLILQKGLFSLIA